MQIINHEERLQVSGGNEIIITRHISTDGISDACVGALIEGVTAFSNSDVNETDIFRKVLEKCSLKELDLFDDRLEEAFIQTISLS